MDKKLTLSLNERVIEKAKVYAQNHKISLSRLIESEDVKITPLVESLSGVVDIPQDFDYKNDYTDYLLEKYQ